MHPRAFPLVNLKMFMKKSIFIILTLSLILGGCSANKSVLNENNVPEKMENYDEAKALEDVAKTRETNNSQNSQASQKENNNSQTNNLKNNMNTVLLKTNKGDIKIKLNSEKAPISVENFKSYVSKGYYTGTIFHRVIADFMIQGGGFDEAGKEKTTEAQIKNEATNGLLNNRGTIAMARTMVVDSATSQFFINLKDNDFLNYKDQANYGYAVFGEVVEGMDVVDLIAGVETGTSGGHGDWPIENIIVESASLVE